MGPFDFECVMVILWSVGAFQMGRTAYLYM